MTASDRKKAYDKIYADCVREACAEVGCDSDTLLSKLPATPEDCLDPGQMGEYLSRLARNAQTLMTGEECLAALKANETAAVRMEELLRAKVGE